jgi:tetratricopeptide (TPR) repeat protein
MRQKRIRRDDCFAAAEKQSGAEKAKLLDQGLSEVGEEIANVYYEETVKEIIALDANDELGLRTKWNAAAENETRKLIVADIRTMSRLEKPENVIAFIDQAMSEWEFPIEQKFSILQTKYQLLLRAGSGDLAAQLLQDMIALEELDDQTRQRLIVRQALQLAGNQQIDQAIQALDQALLKDPGYSLLQVAKGELLARQGKNEQALQTLDQAIAQSRLSPDTLIEAVAAKAEVLTRTNQMDLAIAELDKFAEDPQLPTDLRCEAMLQQAMIMRQMGRRRPATLKENKAVETADSPALKREILTVVEQIRAKADNAGN